MTRFSGHVTPLRSTNKDGSGLSPTYLLCRKCRKSGFTKPSELLAHADEAHGVSSMPFPCTACRLNGYKWRESLNKHRRSGCCRGPNWENNWKTGVSYTQLSDSVAMNSQHSDSSTRLNGRTTPTSARSKKRPPPPSTTSPPSFKRVRKSAPFCEDSTSRNTFNGKSDFGKDTSLSSVHHDASKIVAAGRLSLLDWDAFIGLSKKRRRLSLLPRRPEDSLCDAFTVGHTLPNGLSRGHLVTGLPPPTQDKVSSALRRRDVSSSVGLSNLINGKKSTDVTVTKHPKAIAGSTITFDESSHMLSETLSPQRSFLCNGYEAKLPDLGFSTSPSINPFPSTCRRLPTDLSNHMNKSHNLGIHPCVSNSSAAIDSLTKQSILPSTSPVNSDCPSDSITTYLDGHKASTTPVGRKTRRHTPSHMTHDSFDPSDSSVQASLSVVDHTTESMKVVTVGSATKRSPQSKSNVAIEKPSVDQCPSSEILPSTSPVDSDCPSDSITTYLDGHKAPNTPVGRKTRRHTPSHMTHDDFDPSDSSVQASLSVVDHTTESMKVVTEGSATKRSPQSKSNVAIEKPSVGKCPSSEGGGGVHDSSEDSDQSKQSYDPRLAGLCPNCSRIFPNATGLNGHLRWCKDKFNLSNATGSQVSSEPDSCSLAQPTSSVSDAHVTGKSVDVADSTTGALKRADKNGSSAAHATVVDAGPHESEMTEMATGSQVSSEPDSCSLSQPTSSVSDAHVTGESVDVADSTTGALKRADKNGSAAAHATVVDAGPDESEMTEMPTLDNRQSTPDVVRKSTESSMCVASEGTESWKTAPVTETGIVASPPPVPRPEERSNDTPNSLCEPSPAEFNSHSASDSFTSSKDILCPYCCRQFLQPRFLRIHLRKCPQAPTKLTRDVVATTTPLTDTNGDSTAGGATSPLTCPTCFREFRKLKYVNAHVPRCGVSEMGASLFASISATGSQVSSEPDSCSLAQPTSSVSDAHVTGESVDVADSPTGALKRADKNGSSAAQATLADAGPDESEMTEMPTLDNRQSTPDVVRKSTESNMCVASEGTESWKTAPVTETGIVAILPSTSPVDSDCPSDSITTYLNGHKAPNTPVGRKTRRHTPSHMTHDGFDPSDSSVQASLSVVDHTTGSMKVVTEGSATKRSPQSRSNVAIEKPSVDKCPSSESPPPVPRPEERSNDTPNSLCEPSPAEFNSHSASDSFTSSKDILCPYCCRQFLQPRFLRIHLRKCPQAPTKLTRDVVATTTPLTDTNGDSTAGGATSPLTCPTCFREFRKLKYVNAHVPRCGVSEMGASLFASISATGSQVSSEPDSCSLAQPTSSVSDAHVTGESMDVADSPTGALKRADKNGSAAAHATVADARPDESEMTEMPTLDNRQSTPDVVRKSTESSMCVASEGTESWTTAPVTETGIVAILPSTSPVDSDCPSDSITTYLNGHKAPNTPVGRKTRRHTPSHMTHDDFDPSDSSVQASLSVVDHTTESMKVVTEGSATKRSPQSKSNVAIEKPSVGKCPSSELCSTAWVLPSVSVDDPPEDGGGSRQSYDPRFATLCPNCSRMFQNVNCLHGHLRWCKDDSTLATSPSASGAPSNQDADSASVSTISTTHPIELHLGDRAGTPVSSLTDAGTSSSTLPAEDDPTPRLSVARRLHKGKSHSLSLHRQTSSSEPARSSAFGLTTSSKGTDRDMIDPVGKNSSDIGPAGPCKPIFEAVTLRPRRHSLPAVKRSSSALVQYSCHSEEQFPRLRLRIRMSVDGSTNYSSSPVATTPLSHGATSLNAGTSGSRYHFRSTRLSAESVCSSVDESRSVISDATTLPAVQKATSRKRKTGPYRRRCAWCHVLFHDRRRLYAHKVKCHARPKSLTHSHCVNQMETRNKLGLSTRLWQCACGMKYRSRAVLRAHVAVGCPKSRRFQSIMRVSSQVGCPGCPKNAAPFDSADAVLTHLLSLKPGSGHPYASHGLLSTPRSWPSYLSVPNLGFGCHICGLLLASESRLDKHKRAMHETWLLAEQKNALSPAKATAL